MALFYVCALLMAPMLFMGMIGSARAEENVQEPIKDTSVTGPGKSTQCQPAGQLPHGTIGWRHWTAYTPERERWAPSHELMS